MGPRSVDRGKKEKNNTWQSLSLTSMGPRSVDRGKAATGSTGSAAGAASMGPRSVDRGKILVDVKPSLVNQASMGPRSVDRGKSKGRRYFYDKEAMLQWGLDLLIEERKSGYRRHHGWQSFNGASIC